MYKLYNKLTEAVTFKSIKEIRSAARVGNLYIKRKGILSNNVYTTIKCNGCALERIELMKKDCGHELDYFRVFIGDKSLCTGKTYYYITDEYDGYEWSNDILDRTSDKYIKVLGPKYHIDHLTDEQVLHMIMPYY